MNISTKADGKNKPETPGAVQLALSFSGALKLRASCKPGCACAPHSLLRIQTLRPGLKNAEYKAGRSPDEPELRIHKAGRSPDAEEEDEQTGTGWVVTCDRHPALHWFLARFC
jgi:hypothetical protein